MGIRGWGLGPGAWHACHTRAATSVREAVWCVRFSASEKIRPNTASPERISSGVIPAKLMRRPFGFGRDTAKFNILNFGVIHDNEMYGTMAVYMRLKGVVPPSTADRPMGQGKGGKK